MSEASLLCCPECRGPLRSEPEAYLCDRCDRGFPIVLGIPDLRLEPDPYISFEDEYQKARRLAEEAESRSFEDLLRYYWQITPDVPTSAAERYVAYALDGLQRGKACLEAVDADAGGRVSGGACLDVGCGTGGFLLAAGDRFRTVIGADVALRWLIIARKQAESAGQPVSLVCCSGERLPFRDGAFGQVVGLHVLEHTRDPRAILAETARTLERDGRFLFSTPNRFSLGPEPCVRVWGVGFLPRRQAVRYVRWVKGIEYRNIRLLSWFQLRRWLSDLELREWRISPPRIPRHELQRVSFVARGILAVYHALRRLPVFSHVLRILGPLLQIAGRK